MHGIRVLDLTRVLAGPFCTQLFADYGADVIKVEQPDGGDETRTWKSQAEASKWHSDTMSLYFSSVNRNKRSVTLNLKKSEARDILYMLVKKSDVLIQNLVPGKADDLGLSYDVLSDMNPRLIYASISGYGDTGPYAKRGGYDAIAAAEAGLMHITGFPDGPPMRPGLGMTDMSTGLLTHGAILAALNARHTTGRGQHISTSLFETQLSLLINVGLSWLNLGVEGRRWGAAHPSIVPYNTYQTKDGSWLTLGANNDRQFRVLCQRFGIPEVAADERFRTNAMRVAQREVVDAMVADNIKQKTMQEWLEELDGSGLAHGPVNTIQRAFEHPQAVARDMVQTVDCEKIEGGELKLIGPAAKFSETKAEVRTRPPLLGEHTDDVLRELGYTTDHIHHLRKHGVV